MERQIVLTEADAFDIANTLRVLAGAKPQYASTGNIMSACELADKLNPLSDGPWLPRGWYGDERDLRG